MRFRKLALPLSDFKCSRTLCFKGAKVIGYLVGNYQYKHPRWCQWRKQSLGGTDQIRCGQINWRPMTMGTVTKRSSKKVLLDRSCLYWKYLVQPNQFYSSPNWVLEDWTKQFEGFSAVRNERPKPFLSDQFKLQPFETGHPPSYASANIWNASTIQT